MPAPDRKRRLTAFGVAIALLIVTPLAVVAADRFIDVPNSNIFHDDINAIANVGVTRGCNPPANTQYCPDDFVTREQMAAFMNRLGALGPGETPVANAATALEANHAVEADHALSADDAETLAGISPDAFAPAGGTIEIEPNDSSGTANPYPASGPAQGGILGVAGDSNAGADFWSVEHPGGDFAAETRSYNDCDATTGDTVLTVFDEGGAQIANNDDGGTNFCSLIELPNLGAGTYFIRVRSFSSLDVYWYALMVRVNGQPLMAGAALPPADAADDEAK